MKGRISDVFSGSRIFLKQFPKLKNIITTLPFRIRERLAETVYYHKTIGNNRRSMRSNYFNI